MKVSIITTGGTIEGLDYSNELSQPQIVGVSIKDLLFRIGSNTSYEIIPLFSKDSRFISEEDLKILVRRIKTIENNKILITHGTYTMVETARYLGRLNLNKRIILTGAFILGTEENTDADSNLKFAISQFKEQKAGVFIAMHQSVFNWGNVRKNIEKNKFETL